MVCPIPEGDHNEEVNGQGEGGEGCSSPTRSTTAQLHTWWYEVQNNVGWTCARSPSYLYSQTNSALPNLCITSWIPFVGWASIGFRGMPSHAPTHGPSTTSVTMYKSSISHTQLFIKHLTHSQRKNWTVKDQPKQATSIGNEYDDTINGKIN